MTEGVYICDYQRTPIGRYGGALSSVRADDLAAHPISALISRNPALDPLHIEEVWMGCANQAGEDNRNVARMAALLAGLPEDVPGVTVNRLCASGLEAIASAYRAIRSGDMELAIAGGVESMSRAPSVLPKADKAFGRTAEIYDTTIGWRFVNPKMHELYGTDSMPETAENVAKKLKISREDQDAFALASQQKADRALASGRFKCEIAEVPVIQKKHETVVSIDEHPRAEVSLDQLARLKPVAARDGTVTAGNSSGLNDGAAALLIASEASVKRNSLTPVARILGAASSGIAPRIMGLGPIEATRKLLSAKGKTLDQIDVIELNEAFAAQALGVLRLLELEDDDPRVNPNGGAIALGHPLGMSGARIVGTCATELQRKKSRFGVATMCVGVGQGAAVLIERI